MIPVLSGTKKLVYWSLVGLWFVTLAISFAWWFQPQHTAGIGGMVMTTILLSFTMVLPAYFFINAGRGSYPDPDQPVPPGKVAFIVTKVPSEPWAMLKETLVAMIKSRAAYPYPESVKIILADEDPEVNTDTLWCAHAGGRSRDGWRLLLA